jgi:hypothetical protein
MRVLDDLEQLLGKATEGPWRNEDYPSACNPSISGRDSCNVATCGGKHRPKSEKSANAALIVALREVAPVLINAARCLEKMPGSQTPEFFRWEDARIGTLGTLEAIAPALHAAVKEVKG